MNIQGISQSYSIFQTLSTRNTAGTGAGFNPPVMDSSSLLEKEDANSDGVLTIDETQLTDEMFANADTDSDGQLTVDELEEMLANGPPAPPMMDMGGSGPSGMEASSILESEDANSDGVLTLDETRLTEEMFANADTDSDGELTEEELDELLSSGPPPGPPPMGGPMGGGPPDAESILEEEDTDGDGSISMEETRLPEDVFTEMDTNGDGFLSQDEIEQGLAARQEASGSNSGLSSAATVSQGQAIAAYREALSSFMTEYTNGEYTGYNLKEFLEVIA